MLNNYEDLVARAAAAGRCVWSIPDENHPLGRMCRHDGACLDRARAMLAAAGVPALFATLKEMSEHGAGFDLTPTMLDGGSYAEWARYLSRLDSTYRGRAIAALDPAHDHDARCCSAHGTHAMPHRGCVLR